MAARPAGAAEKSRRLLRAPRFASQQKSSSSAFSSSAARKRSGRPAWVEATPGLVAAPRRSSWPRSPSRGSDTFARTSTAGLYLRLGNFPFLASLGPRRHLPLPPTRGWMIRPPTPPAPKEERCQPKRLARSRRAHPRGRPPSFPPPLSPSTKATFQPPKRRFPNSNPRWTHCNTFRPPPPPTSRSPLAALRSTARPRASSLGGPPPCVWIHNVPLRLAGCQSEARGPTSLSHPRCESGRLPLQPPLLKGEARRALRGKAVGRALALCSHLELLLCESSGRLLEERQTSPLQPCLKQQKVLLLRSRASSMGLVCCCQNTNSNSIHWRVHSKA